MAKLLNQKRAIRLLSKHGWEQRIGGKHVVKMVKDGEPRPITLPRHKGQDYSIDLTRAICRQAKIDPDEI